MTSQDDLERDADGLPALPGGRGGASLPDCTAETFKPARRPVGTTAQGGERAQPALPGMTWDPTGDETYVVDFAYLLREGQRCE